MIDTNDPHSFSVRKGVVHIGRIIPEDQPSMTCATCDWYGGARISKSGWCDYLDNYFSPDFFCAQWEPTE